MDSFGKALGASTGCKVINMVAGATITAKDIVAVNTAGTDPNNIIPCTASLQPIGVAMEAATAVGQVIQVAVQGKVTDVVADGSVTAGSALLADNNGAANNYANTDVFAPFAVALEDDDATPVVDIWIFGLGFDRIGI